MSKVQKRQTHQRELVAATSSDQSFAADKDGVRSLMPGLQRGFEVLQMFRRDRPRITRPEIAQELNIPRSTVHRIVRTLASLGFLRQAESKNTYLLGPAVLTLGFEYLGSLDLVQISNPILLALCRKTGCSTHLVVRNNCDIIYLSRHPSMTSITSNTSVGTSLPAHATVTGGVLLAALSPAELKALYGQRPLKRFSEGTPATLAELTRILDINRSRGYAIGPSYYGRGITSVAAPLRDSFNDTVAAINAVALESVVDAEFVSKRLIGAVCEAADTISGMLGAPARYTRAQSAS